MEVKQQSEIEMRHGSSKARLKCPTYGLIARLKCPTYGLIESSKARMRHLPAVDRFEALWALEWAWQIFFWTNR